MVPKEQVCHRTPLRAVHDAVRNRENVKLISAALGYSSTALTEQVYVVVSQEQVAECWGAAAVQLRGRARVPNQPELVGRNMIIGNVKHQANIASSNLDICV